MFGPKKSLDFNFGPELHEFGREVTKELVSSILKTGEYRGVGGHGLLDHHGGPHTQTSIGI